VTFEKPQNLPLAPLRPAVFLDRDGVLNEDLGFVHKTAQLRWIPGAREAVSYLSSAGYLVFVVTNQSGIARGFYREDDVELLHRVMQAEFATHGGKIDAFAYCPHHPDARLSRYRRQCDCRKPAPGMILDLLRQWPVDRRRSVLIGDQPRDLAAATAAGIAARQFTGGNLLDFLQVVLRELAAAGSQNEPSNFQLEDVNVCTA
jgi:D-glycero-D-manno-heptose 1,7-bisphosphate phosphatase